ncbi:unnamed protein product [Aureobasidium pullulans]|nr:unnamed protein product [Aureobasidium pullulans]
MKVLLTGGSGFVAQHCLRLLLKHGSAEKGQQLLSANPGLPTTKLSYVIVKDIAEPNAFDKAIISSPPFAAVLHTASPFHYAATDFENDMLKPVVNGTLNILNAIKAHAPEIKKVVVTSSFAAIINMQSPPEVYDESMWNPISWEQAQTNGAMAYVGSKKFAEKAAWDFMAVEKPGFALATVNPVLVFGPIMEGSLTSLNASEADGQRFIAAAGRYSNSEIASIIKKHFPSLQDKLPEHIELESSKAGYGIDNSSAEKILGVKFRDLAHAVVDTVDSLLKVEA